MTRPRDYRPGEHVPGTVYRVVRLIGAGGMGTVYDVEDTTVGKRYVLKTLHPDLHKRGDLADRMVKEARQLARVSHPNIVEVVTAGATTDDLKLPYYVMEKLNGQSLRTVLTKKGSLELAHAMHIAIDLLDALDNAHDKGVIHRDVKPDNIFLHINPNGLTTTKLLDFGIMKVLDEPGLTAGRFMGTLRYAAPEQLRGETPMPQTDLYAAGLVLYEMIAGKGPFDDEGDSSKIAAAHLAATPPPLMHWGVVVPEQLERLVRTSLSKDPLKRPKDAFTFASQLRNMNRTMAAQRPAVSETSRPTEVPVIGPGTDAPSGPGTQKEPSGAGVEEVAPFAPTEHAATRAGTPDAKAPSTGPQGEARPIGAAGSELGDQTIAQTMTGMTAPPSGGGAHAPVTEKAPAPVDRSAPTHSPTGPIFPPPRGDGSTERMAPHATGGAGEWRAPATLRMSSAPARGSDYDAASDLLARLPPNEVPPSPTDGAAARTLSQRVPGKVKPVVAVSVGLAMTAAMVALVSLIVWGVRSRMAAGDAPPAAAATAPAEPAASAAPVSSPVVAAPTIPPPLDLPPAPSASSAPVASTSPSATAAPPQPARPRTTPARTTPGATPSPAVPPPAPAPLGPAAPPRRKLPGSGL
jgi:eukaryotic-like serine/threonine-protein kinase